GLSDDASAAYTNPAGLTQLVSPEVALEIRSVDTNTRWLDGGNVQYNPFNSSALNYSSQNDDTTSVRAFSFVYPSERMSFAFYRYEIVNYETEFQSAGATWTTGDGSGQFGDIFAYDVNANLEIEVYGAAMGFKVNDQFSLGLGINYYLLDISATTDRFFPDGEPAIREASLNGDGAWGFNLGARWVATDWMSVGLSWRFAPDLNYDAVLSSQSVPGVTELTETDMNVPDVFGIGFSFRPSDAWIINFDVNRVFYSQITDDLNSAFDSDQTTELDPLKLKDGTEIHLGTEYTFATRYPFSVRVGAWHDPAHEMVYRGTPAPTDFNTTLLPPVNAATFSAGRGSETHYTFGMGMAFSNFQVDLGADFSDTSDMVSLSGVYRF
ncbi:OmpP1/FadL family transporter, partial [Dokdonella sp.]|uniref:OmpP1/FadL family transporter n=1 Tax=Dokdonella sp. TaxID=2291710 RepID=UPI003C5D8E54